MLSHIQIIGYKTIRRLEDLALGRLNVLIGANGAGKSNLISFFRMLGHMMEPRGFQHFVGTSGGASKLLHDGPRVTPQVEAKLSFQNADDDDGRLQYRVVLSYAAGDTLVFGDEYLWLGHTAVGGSPGAGRKESVLIQQAEAGHEEARLMRHKINRCVVYQFHDTAPNSRIRQKWNSNDGRYLKTDGANLAAFLLRLRDSQPPAYARIVGTLRQIAPFFSDFVLEPVGGSILLSWREPGSDLVFSADQASDGTLRVMALVALLLQPEEDFPEVVILDEPELGLHPFAIKVVAGLLRSASEHAQVILATQSTAFVDEFKPEEIIVVERPERQTQFRRLDPDLLKDWLEEYSLSELWEKNVLGGRPA